MANPLEAFRWEYRILLIHAETPETAATCIAELERQASEVDDRDLVWFVANQQSLQTNKTAALKTISQDRLYEMIAGQALPAESIILIGKDGGIKGHYDRLDLAAIFVRIDGMPMRRAEMER